MKRLLLAVVSTAAIFLAGCADNLAPDSAYENHGPAPYAPPAESHIPQYPNAEHGGL